MRGNVTVLFILGMFLVGAIWITIWAPSIPDSVDNSSSISWWKHKVPSSPIAGLGPLEIKKLTDKKRGELALLNKKIKRRKKSSPWRKKMETKRDELKKQVALAEQQIAKGKTVYDQYCAHCHGAKGEADGQFSNFLPIRPRHLAQANYRFKTTSQGRLPHDEDLYRTLSLGLRGTPMPGFARTLSHEQIWNVIQYIKTFGSKWTRTAFYDRGKPIEGLLGPRPAGPTPPALAKTMPEVYKNNCEKCHGATGRGDGNSAAEQMDTSAGAKTKSPILPRNFHQPWLFKRGHTIEDIALTISRGLDSSGMPEHGPPGPPVGTLTRQQIWALAAYVYDMGKNQPRPTVDKQRPIRVPGRPKMEVCIRSRAWTYERLTKVASKDSKSKRSSAVERWEPLADNSIVVNQGDLVLIVFRTADNGLGEGQGLAIAGYEQQVYLTGVTSNESKKLILRADKAGTFKIYNPVHSAPGNVLAQMTGTLIVKPATTKK